MYVTEDYINNINESFQTIAITTSGAIIGGLLGFGLSKIADKHIGPIETKTRRELEDPNISPNERIELNRKLENIERSKKILKSLLVLAGVSIGAFTMLKMGPKILLQWKKHKRDDEINKFYSTVDNNLGKMNVIDNEGNIRTVEVKKTIAKAQEQIALPAPVSSSYIGDEIDYDISKYTKLKKGSNAWNSLHDTLQTQKDKGSKYYQAMLDIIKKTTV